MSKDVASHCKECQSCQRRKTPHRGPPIPRFSLPASKPFERVAIDLVEYKTISKGCKYVLSDIDHSTRYVILMAVPDKSATTTIARVLVYRVFAVFGVPHLLHIG